VPGALVNQVNNSPVASGKMQEPVFPYQGTSGWKFSSFLQVDLPCGSLDRCPVSLGRAVGSDRDSIMGAQLRKSPLDLLAAVGR
jgi:hypothetical protein